MREHNVCGRRDSQSVRRRFLIATALSFSLGDQQLLDSERCIEGLKMALKPLVERQM